MKNIAILCLKTAKSGDSMAKSQKKVTFRHTIATFLEIISIFAASLHKSPKYMKYRDTIVGRKHEQDILQMCYDSPKAEFVAV